MNEVVDKYGVVWVAAGGNHGPALFTIGTPPSISTNNIIGRLVEEPNVQDTPGHPEV